MISKLINVTEKVGYFEITEAKICSFGYTLCTSPNIAIMFVSDQTIFEN